MCCVKINCLPSDSVTARMIILNMFNNYNMINVQMGEIKLSENGVQMRE